MSRKPTSPEFIRTSRSIGGEADTTAIYVRDLAKRGLVPYKIASNGVFLFADSAVALVRQLKREGLSRRGGLHGRAAATAATG